MRYVLCVMRYVYALCVMHYALCYVFVLCVVRYAFVPGSLTCIIIPLFHTLPTALYVESIFAPQGSVQPSHASL